MKWHLRAAGVRERAPVLIADLLVWRRWLGSREPNDSFDQMDGVVGVVDIAGRPMVPFAYEGGIFDVGIEGQSVLVLQHYDADDGNDANFDVMREEVASGRHDEFGAGELQIGGGLVIGDSWEAGDAITSVGMEPAMLADLVFFAPLLSGDYVVLEGHTDDATWYRIQPGRLADHPPREEG